MQQKNVKEILDQIKVTELATLKEDLSVIIDRGVSGVLNEQRRKKFSEVVDNKKASIRGLIKAAESRD